MLIQSHSYQETHSCESRGFGAALVGSAGDLETQGPLPCCAFYCCSLVASIEDARLRLRISWCACDSSLNLCDLVNILVAFSCSTVGISFGKLDKKKNTGNTNEPSLHVKLRGTVQY